MNCLRGNRQALHPAPPSFTVAVCLDLRCSWADLALSLLVPVCCWPSGRMRAACCRRTLTGFNQPTSYKASELHGHSTACTQCSEQNHLPLSPGRLWDQKCRGLSSRNYSLSHLQSPPGQMLLDIHKRGVMARWVDQAAPWPLPLSHHHTTTNQWGCWPPQAPTPAKPAPMLHATTKPQRTPCEVATRAPSAHSCGV